MGTQCWGQDAGGNSVGSRRQQAGTLLHEFGHNLGLAHGGNESSNNNKPNYLSVMNYTFQDCSVTTALPLLPGGCDFSRIELDKLEEDFPPGLDECVGLGGGLGLGPVNWDLDMVGGVANLEGAACVPPTDNVEADINGDTNLTDLTGFEDWNNLRYDFRNSSFFADGNVPPFPDEATPEMIADAQDTFAEMVAPTLAVDKAGPADAIPGDTLNYTIQVRNIGNGPSLNTTMTDTLPDSTVTVFNLGTVIATANLTQNDSFTVSCTTADLTVIQNVASVTGEDMLGNPVSGSDAVQTTVHAPVPSLVKTATATVDAAEAITYSITYENTGSSDAANVVITDQLPAGVYYNQALDLGAGPQPTTVTVNGDGTQTLTWQVGNLPGHSGPQTIIYTARPSLLFLGGESLSNTAQLSFENTNGCAYELTASATTTITVVQPTRDPRGRVYWRTHSSLWTSEILARIQATDQRYDTNEDGLLSTAEVAAMLAPGSNQPKVLKMQLLSTLFNLATRRINAATSIKSKLTDELNLDDVAEATIYAMDTLTLPVNSDTRPRYHDANEILDMINSNRIEKY
jgi:uncharacterized repeat protein (TIGR01451 family)